MILKGRRFIYLVTNLIKKIMLQVPNHYDSTMGDIKWISHMITIELVIDPRKQRVEKSYICV